MRLRRLDLTRYGRFTDHRIDFGLGVLFLLGCFGLTLDDFRRFIIRLRYSRCNLFWRGSRLR